MPITEPTDLLDEDSLQAWQRALRHIELGRGFSLVIVFTARSTIADACRANLEDKVVARHEVLVKYHSETELELSELAERLLVAPLADTAGAIWIDAIPRLGNARARKWTLAWRQFAAQLNERRDILRARCPVPVFIVATPEVKSILRDWAPDLWSVRTLVLELTSVGHPHEKSRGAAPASPRGTNWLAGHSAGLPSACAKIHAGGTWGTGFLVSPDIALTTAHVTTGWNGDLVLEFPTTAISAQVIARDLDLDYAVLRLSVPHGNATPLMIGETVSSGQTWESFGYAGISENNGLFLYGRVLGVVPGRNGGSGTIALHSAMLDGTNLRGFSGAPVVVDGRVVGITRSVFGDGAGNAALGTLHAIPIWNVPFRELGVGINKHGLSSTSVAPPGGPYDRRWYVHRPEETQVLKILSHPGSSVIIQGPHQSGKTALCHAVLEHLAERELVPSVFIDCSLLDQKDLLSSDKFFQALALEIVDSLELRSLELPSAMISAAWDLPFSPAGKFYRLIKQRILPQISGPIILVFDEIDKLSESPILPTFLATLRSLGMSRPRSNLHLMLTLSIPPEMLLPDERGSPFWNIAYHVEIGELGAQEIMNLAEKYGIKASPDDAAALGQLTGGQVYLVHLALYIAHHEQRSIGTIVDTALSQEGIFNGYLQSKLLSLQTTPGALEVMCRVLEGHRVALEHDSLVLYRLGLVRRQDGGVIPASRMYEDFFKRACASPVASTCPCGNGA